MKSYTGYLKQKLGDSYALLAGGSHKSLGDFLGSIQYDSTNKKLQYKAANASSWSNLVTFGSHAFDSTDYLSLSGGTLSLGTVDDFAIKKTSNDIAVINFRGSDGTNFGYLGINGVNTPIFRNTSGTHYTLYHSGNLPAYPTKSSWNYDDVYLKLTGGTLSLDDISGFTIKRTNAINSFITFYALSNSANTLMGWLGFHDVDTPTFRNTSGTYYTLYHTGNLPAYPTKSSWNYDDVYLKLSGGTLSLDNVNAFIIKKTNNNIAVINFRQNDTNFGYLGIKGANNPIFRDTSNNDYTLYHTGNLTPSDYLPKSGGTLTGQLTISTATLGGQLTIHRNDSAGNAIIKFTNVSDGVLGYIGISGSPSSVGNKVPYYNDGTSSYALLHKGNITSRNLTIDGTNYTVYSSVTNTINLDNVYLNLSGGTITCSSLASFAIKRTGNRAASIKFENATDGLLGYIYVGGSGSSMGKIPVYEDSNGTAHHLLHNDNYTTYLDTSYVKLDGGSGEQTITSGISSWVKGVIELYRSTNDGYSILSFANNNSSGSKQMLGAIGFNNVADLVYSTPSHTYYNILHAGNYTSYVYSKTQADNRYVNVSGDTMTGALTIDSDTMGGTPHLIFSRSSYNYVTFPSDGILTFQAGYGGGAGCTVAINATELYTTTNASLGSSSYYWNYLYSKGATLINDSYASQLTVKRNHASSDSVIEYSNTSGRLGLLGFSSSGLYCRVGSSSSSYYILHENNYSDYLDDRYVRLTASEQTIASTISSYNKGIVEFYRAYQGIAFIGFANQNSSGSKQVLGSIGFDDVGALKYRDTSANRYTIFHEGNITSRRFKINGSNYGVYSAYTTDVDVDAIFVNASGDTMSGDLYLTSNSAKSPELHFNRTTSSGAVNWGMYCESGPLYIYNKRANSSTIYTNITFNYDCGNITVGGNCYASNFYTSSDIRLKTNIIPISKNIKQFNLKKDNSLSYGFVAQELERKHPELVSDGDMKTVNYNAAICLLLAKLENRLERIERELNIERREEDEII